MSGRVRMVYLFSLCVVSLLSSRFTASALVWLSNYLKYLVGKPKGKRPLGRPRRRWVFNIKMDLREI
jgi:hypothetical protein